MSERQAKQPHRHPAKGGLVPTDERGGNVRPTTQSLPVDAPVLPPQPAGWQQTMPPAPFPPPLPTIAPAQVTNVNVSTNGGGPTMVFTHHKTGPGFFIRALWYLCIGWWASAFAILAAYGAMITVIGIPLAFFILNRLPTILTLRPRTARWAARTEGDVTYVELGNERQRPWWQRAVFFLLIGWWFGAVWLTLAYFVGLLVITLPLTFWMYNRVSGVMTLHRH